MELFNIDGVFVWLLYIVCIVIGFVCIIMIVENNRKKTTTKLLIIFTVLWCTFVVYCLICLRNVNHYASSKTTLDVTDIEHIVALQDSSDINGKFYFRYGYVETSIYLNYIVDIGDNKYVPNKIPLDKTTIRYTKDDPRVEWYKERYHNFLFYRDVNRYYVYVPEGTVIDDFSIDLK